jgi:hypothetical protein
MAPVSRGTLRLVVAPAGLLLLLAALADGLGASTVVFYLFLVGIVVSAAGGLAAFARIVDEANGEGPPPLARLQGYLSAALVGLFVIGAAARSPVSLELGAPGLTRAALVLAFLVLSLQALTALFPLRR